MGFVCEMVGTGRASSIGKSSLDCMSIEGAGCSDSAGIALSGGSSSSSAKPPRCNSSSILCKRSLPASQPCCSTRFRRRGQNGGSQLTVHLPSARRLLIPFHIPAVPFPFPCFPFLPFLLLSSPSAKKSVPRLPHLLLSLQIPPPRLLLLVQSSLTPLRRQVEQLRAWNIVCLPEGIDGPYEPIIRGRERRAVNRAGKRWGGTGYEGSGAGRRESGGFEWRWGVGMAAFSRDQHSAGSGDIMIGDNKYIEVRRLEWWMKRVRRLHAGHVIDTARHGEQNWPFVQASRPGCVRKGPESVLGGGLDGHRARHVNSDLPRGGRKAAAGPHLPGLALYIESCK